MTTTEPVVRIADTSDIPAISILAHAVWPHTYGSILSEDQISYMLDLFYSHDSLSQQFSEGNIFLIAMMNAETVGFASYSPTSTNNIYKIHKLYVHPLLHGKGFGRVLLDKIREDVLKKAGNRLQLNVNRYNRAVSFYERYGFEKVAEEDIPIGKGYFMNDYVMEMKI